MRIPLRFQITEFDCGTVTLQNAISYLFDRKEIPAEIIRAISLYTLDCYNNKGNLGSGGTSKEAMEMMTHWITDYTNTHHFNITANHYLTNDVTLKVMKDTTDHNGCVVLKTYLDGGHYVLVTDITDKYVYIWDPYYLDEDYYKYDDNIKIVLDKPFKYNRIVNIDRFLSEQNDDLALGTIEKRECVCFKKNK